MSFSQRRPRHRTSHRDTISGTIKTNLAKNYEHFYNSSEAGKVPLTDWLLPRDVITMRLCGAFIASIVGRRSFGPKKVEAFSNVFGICCRTQATDSCTMADADRKWTLCKCFYEVCELFFVSSRAQYFNQIGNRRWTVVRRWPKLQKLTKWLCFSRVSLTFLWFEFKVWRNEMSQPRAANLLNEDVSLPIKVKFTEFSI